jgi:hypothetical protein
MRLVLTGIGAGLLAALAASGCGPASKPKTPEHIALVKYCKSDGGQDKACECAADKTDALLEASVISPDMYRALVLEAEGKAEESDALMDAMTIHEKFAQVTAVGDAKVACASAPAS